MKVMSEEKKNKRRPKIVVIGGGTGLPIILKKLKERGADVTGIVTVADDGGSSGMLRNTFNTIPPGDIRNVLVALSDMPERQKRIFQYRFQSEGSVLDNHPIGNLIIQAAADVEGNIYKAIQVLSKMMLCDGHVYPSSEVPLTLHARYTDGTVASGESVIAQEDKKIDYVAVSNSEEGYPVQVGRKVVSSIKEADLVVLGPGSLYTSILPNLMIPDLGQAVIDTKAQVVYICNIMTQLGETEEFSDAEHIKVLHRHLNSQFIDTSLVNIGNVPDEYVALDGNNEYLYQVQHDFSGLREEVKTVISDNFLELRPKGVYHNGERVANELFKIAFDQQHQRV